MRGALPGLACRPEEEWAAPDGSGPTRGKARTNAASASTAGSTAGGRQGMQLPPGAAVGFQSALALSRTKQQAAQPPRLQGRGVQGAGAGAGKKAGGLHGAVKPGSKAAAPAPAAKPQSMVSFNWVSGSCGPRL